MISEDRKKLIAEMVRPHYESMLIHELDIVNYSYVVRKVLLRDLTDEQIAAELDHRSIREIL